MLKFVSKIVVVFLTLTGFYMVFIRRISHSGGQISKLMKLKQPAAAPEEPLLDEVTIVTAYFDIGSFQKGTVGSWGSQTYQHWMSVFKLVENPLIVFVDNHRDFVQFKAIRMNSPSNRTLIIKLHQKKMWSFGLVPRIAQVYNQTGYPKFHPNTVKPGYSAAMHAKYEVVQLAIRANTFRTKYFCWLDVGLFRHSAGWPPFSLYVPVGHEDDAISVNKIGPRDEKMTPKHIIYNNIVWLGGGFFIGRWDVMFNWTKEYMRAAENLLSMNLMSTDQQVVYSAFNNATHPPLTKLKIYDGWARTFTSDEWFHLAYLARDAGAKRKAKLSANNDTSTSTKKPEIII